MKKFPLIALLIAILVSGLASARGGSALRHFNRRADSVRAAYMVTEAYNRLNLGEVSAGITLLRHAMAICPDDPELAFLNANLLLPARLLDSVAATHLFDMATQYVLAHPEDYFASIRMADFADNSDRSEVALAIYRNLAAAYPDRNDIRLGFATRLGMRHLDAIADDVAKGLPARGDTVARDSAVAILNEIERRTGPDPSIIYQTMCILINRLDTAAIVERIDNYRLSAPADPNVLLNTARLFDVIGLSDSVSVNLDRACTVDSTFGAAFMERAAFYLQEGDSARYESEVENVLRSPGLDFDDKFDMLTEYVARGFSDTVPVKSMTHLFETMEELHPGEARLHALYGGYLAETDSAAAAAEQFGYAVDLNPADPTYYQYLISTLLESGDTVRALETSRSGLSRFKDNMYYALVTASVLMQQNHYAEAITALDSFDTSDYRNMKAVSVYHQTRGDIFHQMNLNDSAYVEYDLAIDADPENSMAMNNLAYFMALDDVDLDRAETLAQRAVSLDPLNPTILDTYAWVLFRKKKYPEAKRQIDLALGQYSTPDNDEKAGVETSAGDDERETPSADIYDHAGDIYFMNGEPAQALDFWKKALELSPGNASIERKVTNKTYFFE